MNASKHLRDLIVFIQVFHSMTFSERQEGNDLIVKGLPLLRLILVYCFQDHTIII